MSSRRCAPAWALTAALLLAAVPAAVPSEEETGLDLAGRKGIPVPVTVGSARIGNPHDQPCPECHAGGDPVPGNAPLKTGDDSIRLCLGCHPDGNLHPVGVEVTAAPDEKELPLGRGSLAGKITCLTCHYLHRGEHRRNLLRGEETGTAHRRDTLCARCHAGKLLARSPHGGEGSSCHLCHMSPPRQGEVSGASLDPNLQTICNFCHNAVANEHYFEVNPFADETLMAATRNTGVPLLGGRFTCVSCHDPHSADTRRKMLRDVYLDLASLSERINPHWKDIMCITCHDGEPARGEPRLRDRGDLNQICNRCHAGRYSRHDIHPINVMASEYVAIPPGMPLKDGRVTCETCHDSSLQEGGERNLAERRRNPKFLRGGFTGRNEFCARCHPRENFRLMNPHLQLSEKGEINVLSCLFCHSSLPDTDRVGIELAGFDVESLNDSCTFCHSDAVYLERHPQAPHLVRPSDRIRRTMESSAERMGIEYPLYDGKIVCVTCHNPHQEGVLKAREASSGAGDDKRLRRAGGKQVCSSCHGER